MAVHSSLLLVSFTLLLTVNSVVPFPSSPLQTSWTKTEATTKPFRLVDDYEGSNFFPAFDFEAIADPTHGAWCLERVHTGPQQEAEEQTEEE
eukprot:m.31641 g.31641  ORF g.31641 m.31641 type:complete len:92 (+) comp10701_c0_seq3:165-440(+)